MNNKYLYSYNRNIPYNSNPYYLSNSNDERLIGGGFLGPFILGGITGGLVSPLFFGNGYNNRPQVYYYQPGPYNPYLGPRPF